MIVGIVGGGQLARMMALAGYPLGLDFIVLDPSPQSCAGQVAELLIGAYDDRDKLAELAKRADVVTFDFENVPAEAVGWLADHCPVYPPPDALAAAQDRLDEKTLFRSLGIATAPFAAVDSRDDLQNAIEQLGLPAVLKTRRFGYDGKGQTLLRSPDDLEPAWQQLGGSPLILEGFVDFDCEVSLIAARDRQGQTVFYPLTENRHRDGILHLSRAPYPNTGLQQQAEAAVGRLLDRLDYVGVLAVEWFVTGDRLIANEMAPRVHNSGHWTIEGAETSQFENHLRAVTGLPLGSTACRGVSAMINFIGDLPDRAGFLALPDAHFHDYGKTARAGRKVGHGTLRCDNNATLEWLLQQALQTDPSAEPPLTGDSSN